MNQEEFCPHCQKSLRGNPIPEKHRHLYGAHTHYGLQCAIYDSQLDRTVGFQCPFCSTQWDRGLDLTRQS